MQPARKRSFSGRIPGLFEMGMCPRGRVNCAAVFARLLKQAKTVFGLLTTVKVAHRPLQRMGNPGSRGVHSPAATNEIPVETGHGLCEISRDLRSGRLFCDRAGFGTTPVAETGATLLSKALILRTGTVANLTAGTVESNQNGRNSSVRRWVLEKTPLNLTPGRHSHRPAQFWATPRCAM